MARAEGSARRAVRAGAAVTGAVRVVVDDNEKSVLYKINGNGYLSGNSHHTVYEGLFLGILSSNATGVKRILTHQISFHTLSALRCLTFERSDRIHDRKTNG